MNIRRIELVPRTLEAVQFTPESARDLVTWIQDRTPQGTIVLGDGCLYIHGVEGTEKVEVGEWVLYDTVDRFMRSATDGAVQAFYRDVLVDNRSSDE